MQFFPAALQNLADQFAKLPGIGGKTAQRLAFHVLSLPMEDAEEFSNAILEAKKQVHTCPVCQNLTDREVCPICDDDTRDKSVICVVAEPKDVIAMERSREFRGVYHVLHGVISPLNHVSQDDIKIKELLRRVAGGEVREVIMATNPDTEGEATAMYISRLLRPMEVKVTRLAYGVPVGSQLEYADEVTLSRALGRASGDVNENMGGLPAAAPHILCCFMTFLRTFPQEAEKEPHRRTPDRSPAAPKASWSGEGSASRPERQRRIPDS